VQDRPVFRDVDRVAAPHRIDARTQSGSLGETREKTHALVIDALAREIQIEAGGLARVLPAAIRIRVAEPTQGDCRSFSGASLQCAPDGGQ
jgi:hypothetical protein